LSEAESSATRKEVVRAAARIVDSSAGHLWVLESDSAVYRNITTFGIDEDAPDIALDDPVVEYVSREVWLIDSEEYDLEPSIYKGLEIDGWLSANNQSWLLVPLISRQQVLGLILLYRSPGSPSLNYEDRDLLKMVGNHIAVHVAQEMADRQLSEARQFETYNKMSAFLMHDISNLVAQLSLVVKNAEKHKRNPEFVDDTIETIANSVGRMQLLLAQLKRSAASAGHRCTNVLEAVCVAVENCAGVLPEPGIDSVDEDAAVSVDPKQFEMVLSHLIKNAQDACTEDGTITIGVQSDADQVIISVSDNGCGMSQQYIQNHLFRPFDSTKGSQGMGIGVYQSREFAKKFGGDLSADSVEGQGTTMKLVLPLERR
jgi:putative PEP-CTERM system histidine kinase